MADTPKSLSDVKALLEEGIQIVKDLEASQSDAPQGAGDATSPSVDETTTDNVQTPVPDSEPEQDNPTPPTA